MLMREGDNIGRVLLLEFRDQDSTAFDEVIEVLKKHTDFEHIKLNEVSVLSLQNLRIYPERRKVYFNCREIELATKEFDILCLLATNKGRVFTYEQIYEKLWNEDAFSNVNNAVGCHIRSLRRKLNKAIPDAAFAIRCIRDIGYCLDLITDNT